MQDYLYIVPALAALLLVGLLVGLLSKSKENMNTKPASSQITHGAGTVESAINELGGGSADVSSIKYFGAVGDGIADDTAAVVLAEASTAQRIYLPAGVYPYTGGTLYKYYYGEGQLKLNGQLVGQKYCNILVETPNVSSPAAYGEGDISKVELEKVALKGNRVGLSQYYFDARTTPKFAEFVTNSGHSGATAKITAPIASGATSCTVNNVGTALTPGTQVQIVGGVGGVGAPGDYLTISSVAGTTIHFTTPTTQSYAASPTGAYYLTIGQRTMNPYQYIGVDHRAGGDSYATVARMNVYNDDRQPGQTHFFTTATGGLFGGDMAGCTAGVYLTGWECQYTDNTYGGIKNIAVIGHVDSYDRNSDTGTYGCVWNGTVNKSEGTAYCNSAHVVIGKWQRGLDTVLADLGTDQMAVLLKADQRIGFNGFSFPDADGRALWGSWSSTTYIHLNSALGAMEHVVEGVPVLKYNQTDIYTGTAKFHFGNDAYQSQNHKLYFNGNLGVPNTYLVDDGTYWKVHYKGQDKLLISDTKVYLGNTGVQVELNQKFNLTGQTVTSSASAGAAAALPATPYQYLVIQIDGIDKKIPVYNV